MLLLPDAVTKLGIFGSSGMSYRNFSSSNFEFFSFNTFDVSQFFFSTSCTNEVQIQLLHFLELIVLGFCLLDTE